MPLAAAQQQEENEGETTNEPPSAELQPERGEIIVRAERLKGQLDVDVPPLLELNEEDIAAEGVTSIADLVTQISNQTGSSRGRGGGRPVILINGIRVGSFREFFQYPPEALARVEVFPEEVAQRFGFSPDQRVVNLILKENFSSREVEVEFEGPSRGGYLVNEQELGYLQIKDGGRLNFNFEANDTTLMTEARRGIVQTPGSVSDVAGDPDQAEFRSLINDTRALEASVSWAKAFLESGTSVSANINYDRNDRLGLSGLNTVTLTNPAGDSALRTFGENTPLESRTATDAFSGSGSLSKSVNGFRLTSTANASHSESETQIDRRFDTSALEADAAAGMIAIDAPLPSSAENGFDVANTRSIAASTLTTLRGPLAQLPGGELIATFDVGANWTRIESADTRSLEEVKLTRRQFSTGANLVIPITSRRNGFADALGSFTLTAQAGLEDLSDFGLLGDYNIALNWAPTDRLNFSANYIVRDVAPSLPALGNPEVTIFNTPVFDFSTGETVLANVTTGGNPDLLAETQRDWRFSANWQLPFIDNTRFTVEYVINNSDDVTRAFPTVTPEIEAAFPGRVTRDTDGRLVALDRRFVTFAETSFKRLQFNLFTRGSFGMPQRETAQRGEERGRGGPPSGGRSRGGGGPPAAGGPPTAQQREQFRIFRQRLCAEDGLEFMQRIIARVEAGEDVSDETPGFDPQRFERILSRVRNEDGTIDPERLAAFRERFCAMDPAMFRGRGGQQAGGDDASAPNGQNAGGGMRAAFATLRERICGENGPEQLARIVTAIENGEDTSELVPGMDPQFLKMMLDRARSKDGTIPPEALEQFRERVCSRQGGSGGQRGAGGPFGGGNPFAQGRRQGWRYFVSLNHTINLESETVVAPGLAPLDELAGDALNPFGLSRHNSRLEAGLFGGGIGFRLSGQYNGKARLNGSGLPGSSDLFIGDLVRFDLRAFSNVGDLFKKDDGFLKNLRVSLRFDNVFDARRKVVDENGETPITYQPFLIDPTGRFVGIDIRKLF
ncbi:hypothetical protein [Erythrobacter sp. THAF29]|uniref:hypothetical protein n=1 Tax=Erythrobacter sp. THAF29 TaxID=2587851 RepID=UPI001267F2E0|nr:hypothetical protein [Erythrobacter sp. THAF29]